MPDFEDYNMKGRTYRYIDGEALFPFGYGLSFTKFNYDNANIDSVDDDKITLSVEITNAGDMNGYERAQVYASYTDSRYATPHYQLCALKSVEISKGETAKVSFDIDRYWLKAVNDVGERVEPDGSIKLYVGGHQPDSVSNKLMGYECIALEIK